MQRHDKLLKHFEKSENIRCEDVGIIVHGVKNPSELMELILKSDVYMHPSYIDNSPNSVCEAQILGKPVIACNVGGMPTLIEHMVSGILVPSNGVFEIVHYLIKLKNDSKLSCDIGEKARKIATKRHNTEIIISSLSKAYSEINLLG